MSTSTAECLTLRGSSACERRPNDDVVDLCGWELALALRLHPDVYSAIFCASPGGGYKPTGVVPGSLPRAYLVAGTLEPFFRDNATRWATALWDAGAEVVMTERVGSHGDRFWQEELR